MPSTSPGSNRDASEFLQILPGAPTPSLQGIDTFIFRHNRYIIYISGRQLNILARPTVLIQALSFAEELVAVTAEDTGKIVVASKDEIWVLEPATEGWTKVWWEKALFLRKDAAEDVSQSLSLGGEEEVLVGGSKCLTLFSTLPSSRRNLVPDSPVEGLEDVENRKPLWSKAVSSPLQRVAFSPSAMMIATHGVYDRLVKIWRRLSFEEGLFDHTYLPHPGAVTHLQWRPLDEGAEARRGSGLSGRHDDQPEVLYTISTDAVLRVWRTGGLHDVDILLLYTTVDLVSAIPQSPSFDLKKRKQVGRRSSRYAFVLSSEHFITAATAAIGLKTKSKPTHSLEHLKEISSKEPDVVVTLDGRGRMSAWGLQSIGHKRRQEVSTVAPDHGFHIAHAEDFPVRFADDSVVSFLAWFEDDKLNVVDHVFDGQVHWWQGSAETLFSPSARGKQRLESQTAWTGCHAPIKSIRGTRDAHGHTRLVSLDWQHNMTCWISSGEELRRGSSIRPPIPVVDAIAVGTEEHMISLEESADAIVLRDDQGRIVSQAAFPMKDMRIKSSRLFSAALVKQKSSSQRIVVLSRSGCGCTFLVSPYPKSLIEALTDFKLEDVDTDDKTVHMNAILDAGQSDRFGVVNTTEKGNLHLYHVQVADRTVGAQVAHMITIETGVSNASHCSANNEFVALSSTGGRTLAIVNLRDCYLDHRQHTATVVKHLEIASRHNLLAIGYESSIDILVQGRYEQHHDSASWKTIKRVVLTSLGSTISTVAWLRHGSLALAAGNGLFISSGTLRLQALDDDTQRSVNVDEGLGTDIMLSELPRHLSKALPVWHPSFLTYMILNGHWLLVSSLLVRLLQTLKFWSEGDPLHPLLSISPAQLYGAQGLVSEKLFDRDAVADLLDQLDEKHLPGLTQSEQQRLRLVFKVMSYCAEHVNELDNGALRFLFNWRLQILHLEAPVSRNGTMNGIVNGHAPGLPEMHWREIAFAHQSTTQQALLDILTAHYDDKITWDIARHLGLFAWLSDRDALERIFEALAQSAYRATSPPEPINATLYFLALHKKSTLLALWRMATWHKEQRTTTNFLRRDFTQPENRTAAKKNAYALMGKRRFEYAAAFFLLADDAASATSVLAGQCGDVMLAIAVARLYSGDGSPVLQRLIADRFMPKAEKDRNRWLMSWGHSVLLDRDSAADVLVRSLEGVRTWEQDEPSTMALFRRLRRTEHEEEYEALLRSARILRRMGLWLPALELVSRWEFVRSRAQQASTFTSIVPGREIEENGARSEASRAETSTGVQQQSSSELDGVPRSETAAEPPSLLDAFSPASAKPVADDKATREAKAAELLAKLKAKKKGDASGTNASLSEKQPDRAPTQFKEPDANSLLDSFGF